MTQRTRLSQWKGYRKIGDCYETNIGWKKERNILDYIEKKEKKRGESNEITEGINEERKRTEQRSMKRRIKGGSENEKREQQMTYFSKELLRRRGTLIGRIKLITRDKLETNTQKCGIFLFSKWKEYGG